LGPGLDLDRFCKTCWKSDLILKALAWALTSPLWALSLLFGLGFGA